MKTALILFFLFVSSNFYFQPKQISKVRVLPSGITYISEPIHLLSGDSLVGNNSTLILENGANCPMIIVGDDNPDPLFLVENVSISSIKLIGNKQNQEWEGWLGDPNKKEHSIRNNGITVRHAKSVVINNVDVSDCRSGGIVIERGSSDISVINSTCSRNFFDGIAAYESTNVFLYNLNLVNNDYAGASFDLDFNHNTIANCYVAHNKKEGVFMRHSSRNIFDRLVFSGNAGYSIFLAQSELEGSAAKFNLFLECSFSDAGETMRINDSSCTGNLMIDSKFESTNLIGLLK